MPFFCNFLPRLLLLANLEFAIFTIIFTTSIALPNESLPHFLFLLISCKSKTKGAHISSSCWDMDVQHMATLPENVEHPSNVNSVRETKNAQQNSLFQFQLHNAFKVFSSMAPWVLLAMNPTSTISPHLGPI